MSNGARERVEAASARLRAVGGDPLHEADPTRGIFPAIIVEKTPFGGVGMYWRPSAYSPFWSARPMAYFVWHYERAVARAVARAAARVA